MAANCDMESDAVPCSDLSGCDIGESFSNMNIKEQSPISFQSNDEFIEKYFEYLPPELKVGCYDVMILYHEEELKSAEHFKQHISKLTLKNGSSPKAALYNGPEFVSLSGAEFDNLEAVFDRCTFTFVLLSKLFVKDTWCKLVSQSFLRSMIDDHTKRWCVVPVITNIRKKLDFKVPAGLNALMALKFYEPFDMFNRQIEHLISERFNKRTDNEKILMKERLKCLKVQFEPIFSSEAKCDQISVSSSQYSFQDLRVSNNQPSSDNQKSRNLQLTNGQSSPCSQDHTLNGSSTNSKDHTKHGDGLAKGENFLKKIDNKDLIRNRRIVTAASYSVGIIRGPKGCGTGFRVGDKYIMTALHVVDDNIRAMQGLWTENVDYTRVTDDSFYIEFEFLKKNQKQKEEHIFNFSDLVYKNGELDTAILQLRHREEHVFPPAIRHFGSPNGDTPVYLIGHPKEEPLTDDPKIEMYEFLQEDVDSSNKYAHERFPKYPMTDWYVELNDKNKILFHCASQQGASGALGVMVDPHFDEPVGVLMLLRGYPPFFYLRDERFTNEDTEKFLIVEQGVMLKSIGNDMDIDSEFPKSPELKKEIFGQIKNW